MGYAIPNAEGGAAQFTCDLQQLPESGIGESPARHLFTLGEWRSWPLGVVADSYFFEKSSDGLNTGLGMHRAHHQVTLLAEQFRNPTRKIIDMKAFALFASMVVLSSSSAADAEPKVPDAKDDDLPVAVQQGMATSEEVIKGLILTIKDKCGNAKLEYAMDWNQYLKMPDAVLDGRTRGGVYALAGEQQSGSLRYLADSCASDEILKKAVAKITLITFSPVWHKTDGTHPSHKFLKQKKTLSIHFHVVTDTGDSTDIRKAF
jgi:hypothetical protein